MMWVSIHERLPDKSGEYEAAEIRATGIIYHGEAYFDGKGFTQSDGMVEVECDDWVTHWQPKKKETTDKAQGEMWDNLIAERDRYKAAYEAADKYIEENPCDPDIYPEQWAAWEKYLIAKQALEDKT